MPLPLFLLGAAGAALLGHCAREVNDDYASELNTINDKMEELYEETNVLIKTTKCDFDTAYDKLYDQKNEVFNTTLKNFAEVIAHLKKVEFEGDGIKKDKLQRFHQEMVSYNDNSTHRGKTWAKPSTAVISTVIFGIAGQGISFVGNVIRGVQLQTKIEEANAEYAKLKAECRAAKTKCMQMQSLTELCTNSYEVIELMKELADRLINETADLVERNGGDYSIYTDEECDRIMLMYNFSLALNDIVCTDIVDNEGNLNPQYEKFVNIAFDMLESV